MENRALARSAFRLTTKVSRLSTRCCFAWYNSIPSQLLNSQTSFNARLAHTAKRSPPRTRTQKPQTTIAVDNPQSRAISRLNDLLQDALQILSSHEPPSEPKVLESLATCKDLAKYFKDAEESPNLSNLKTNSAAANLLFLDSHNKPQPVSLPPSPLEEPIIPDDVLSPSTPPPYIASSIAKDAKSKISIAAWDLVRDAKVFITPAILQNYVEIQSTLSHPETLAEVFALYATKPIPRPQSTGLEKGKEAPITSIKYTRSNPNNVSTAVPLPTATAALNAAIRSENLTLCLDIIDRTVCTVSYRRAKIIRKALLPMTGVAIGPVAAYSLASQFDAVQESLSSANATGIALAGILTYLVATVTIGGVAVTTANDHMDRVTWASGMPLRERWLREEERGMLDLVAAAWGFKESWRRGEEEGAEWQALKELIGLRGMVLDKVELMEGME